MKTDILIAGTGVSGLFCALNLPRDKKIKMITKKEVEESDSFLAQGGICVLRGQEDFDSYYQDTLKAGHYENSPESVKTMIEMSPEIIRDLIFYEVEFERDKGELSYTREGGHSNYRILFHADVTGREITSKLLKEVKKRKNIEILEYTTLLDVISENNVCKKAVLLDEQNNIHMLEADYFILATGGVGGLYESTTNYSHITGDGVALALRNNIELKDVDYVQIHPTTLYTEKPGRRFLISESVRGEGALLFNKNMKRFVDELLPRDILTENIYKQMKEDNSNYIWLSMKEMGKEKILKRFPNIYKKCREEGYDIICENVPVSPAQHYYMGGIKVNLNSETSMKRLYAIGETSCNGVHGSNRLASNSLLESLVFAKLSAKEIRENYSQNRQISDRKESLEKYEYVNEFLEKNKNLVRKEIERRHRERG